MAAGAVGKAALPATRIFGLHGDGELQGADIDTTAGKKFCGRLVHEWLLELICDPAFRPGSTLGADLEHAGSQGLRFSTASKREGRGPIFRQAQLRPKGGTASPPKRDLSVVASGNRRYKGGRPFYGLLKTIFEA